METEKALFAAGCFWGIQEYFEKIVGVKKTIVGYSGGKTINPTYEDVCYNNTEHAEVVLIEYNDKEISFKELLEHFWKCHDPTQLNRQGYDIGSQYRSAIFYFSLGQKKIAEDSKDENQKKFGNQIVTQISEAQKFYKAEEYHQKYISKKLNKI